MSAYKYLCTRMLFWLCLWVLFCGFGIGGYLIIELYGDYSKLNGDHVDQVQSPALSKRLCESALPLPCSDADKKISGFGYDGADVATLLRLAAEGDRKAFGIIYRIHWQKLLILLVRKYRLDGYAAEDIAGKAFVSVWQNRHNLKQVRNLGAYLNGVVRNLVADMWAQRVPTISLEFVTEIRSLVSLPEAELERGELESQISRAVNSLTGSHRMALELKRAGLSARQIAAILNCTEKAARRRMEKARRRLRRILSRCGDGCVADTVRHEECPARKENLHCLKHLYSNVLRSGHGERS